MEDKTRPDETPDDSGETERVPKRRDSRLDRLMGAKDKADKEAERWEEIEDLGQPLPSADQPGDVTQPHQVEGGAPPDQQQPPQPPPAPAQPQRRADAPFPHPTDRPARPAKPDRPGLASGYPHPTDRGAISEPPMPGETDFEATRKGVKPPGGQPHRRYQPPPEGLDDVRVDADGMPLPSQRGQRGGATPQDMPTQPHGYDAVDYQPTVQSRGRAAPPAPTSPSRAT